MTKFRAVRISYCFARLPCQFVVAIDSPTLGVNIELATRLPTWLEVVRDGKNDALRAARLLAEE